ncbi:zinc finger, CCHC-type containing protein [Tanacetum coccineum]
MRTTVVLVPTRNQSWNVGSVARLVTLRGIAEVVKRTTQILVVRERGLRTIPKTKVDAIAWWIDSGATTYVCKDRLFCYVYLLHAKDEALDKFRIYKTEVELQQNDLIKTLRTDRGGEYYDPVFFQYVRIIHETTAPYTPQQNGVVERKNRALKEMVNSMIPNKRAVVRLPYPKRKTLGEKGIDCIFVGYAEHSKAYSEIPEPRKGKRVQKAKSYGSDFQLYLVEGSRDQVGSQYSYCYSIEEDPRTYDEAMQSRDAAF